MKCANIELLTNLQVVKSRVHNPLLEHREVLVDEKVVLRDVYRDTRKFDICIQCRFHMLEKGSLFMHTALSSYDEKWFICKERDEVQFLYSGDPS